MIAPLIQPLLADLRDAGGAALGTNRDFTGQRKDGTGLLYYGARYYDPALGRFASADSIAPSKGDPQSRNRYSYVLNNPLKFIDPTGHCVAGKTYEEMIGAERLENAACDDYIAKLMSWGLEVDLASYGNWLSEQLGAVYEGARRMSAWLGLGDDGRLFKERILQGRSVIVTKVSEFQGCNEGDFACTTSDKITFTKRGLTGNNPDQWAHNQKTVIHELAHLWDFRKGRELQQGLEMARGPTGDVDRFPEPIDPRNPPTAEEDFAESVAFYVMERSPIQGNRAFVNSARWYYVACVAQGRSASECTGGGADH
jgi:RHS repeat-associated protein